MSGEANSAMPSGKQKEIDVLKKLVKDAGYKVVPSGSGHWKVLDPKGAVVIDKDGPLILSGSSSEQRSRAMSVSRLIGAGVLKRDPWAPAKAKDGDGPEEEAPDAAEIARREREAEQARSLDQERSARTHRIRERLEPIVARLGGWDKRGNLSEIGLVAHYVAKRLELDGAWVDAQAASENADALRKGATLSQAVAPLWEELLSELEAWPDTRVRWFQLVGEAKGANEPTIGALESRSGWRPQDEPVVSEKEPATNGHGKIPMLALRAMFEMGVGRPAIDPDRRHIIELGVEIARLEMAGQEEGGTPE